MPEHDSRFSGIRWRGLLADVALMLFVAALGVKAAWGCRSIHDLDGGDELSYLLNATLVGKRGLPSVEGSPVYILWDWLLLRAGVPAEDVPFVSWALFASLLPATVYLLVRAIGGGRLAALLAGGVLPATTLIDVYPYPMHLATIVLTVGAAIASRLRRVAPAAAVLGITLLLATYTRPEFLYSLYLYVPLATVGAVWLSWARPESRRSVLVSLALLAAGSALLIWVFGSPKGSGGRAIVAFGQHYAVSRNHAGDRTENPWLQWELYVHADFGKVVSVGDAWRSNPTLFLRHVRENACRLPRHLEEAFAPRVDLKLLHHCHIFPMPDGSSEYTRTEGIAKIVMLVWGLLGLLGSVVGLWRQFQGGEVSGQLSIVAVMLGLVALPALAASLIIYPRFHYLIPTLVFATALSAAGLRYLRFPDRFRGRIATGVAIGCVAVGLAAVVPNRAHGWCLQSSLGHGENGRWIIQLAMPERACVRTLRELRLQPPVTLLDYGVLLNCYCDLRGAIASPSRMRKGESFLTFVNRMNVGVVILDPQIAEFPQLRDDPDFRSLIAGNETPVFRIIPVDGFPDRRFAVRRDLLHTGLDQVDR